MVCPFCGKELADNEIFCPDCSASLGIATAVAERPAVQSPAPEYPPPNPPTRRKKPRRPLFYLMTVLCALSLSVLALLAGAYYDTADPLGLQGILWPADGAYAVPPKPGAAFNPDAPPDGLSPLVTPASRGAPVGDDKDNAALLLEAAVSLDAGLTSGATPDTLSPFLWRTLFYAGPDGRFDETADGFFVPSADMDDLCRETLGRVPDGLSDGPSLTAVQGGYTWRDDFLDDLRIDLFDWSEQPDGSVRVRFNVLLHGMLYDTFQRQGEAVLTPNTEPVYYRYCLSALSWNSAPLILPSRITASSTLRGEGNESYMPNKLIDGNPATAWAAGAAGDGAGEWLELAFDSPREITGLTLVNGWCKDLASMRLHNRVKGIRLDCAGFSMEFELEDILDYYTGGEFQSVTFGQAVTTDRIKLTILSVYKGSSGTHVSLGEISLF